MGIHIEDVISSLANVRPIFYSEADFQHSIAWEIHAVDPKSKIRLEVPFSRAGSSEYLDLLVHSAKRTYAIELKYKTRGFSVQVGEEEYQLKNQSAQILGRYDFFHDLKRVEDLCKDNPNWTGWAVFLTNDSSYWKPPGRPNVAYRDFSMEQDRVVSGKLKWGRTAGKNTIAGRERPIRIRGKYRMEWKDYSRFDGDGYSTFRYLAVHVSR